MADNKSTCIVQAKRKICAGSFFLIAFAQLYYFTTIAEGLYPNYSMRTNFISDLGVRPESAILWGSSMFVAGILVIAGSLFILSEQWKKIEIYTVISFFFTGIGLVGVAIFNENAFHTIHIIFALVAFVFGGISAILYSISMRGSFKYISLVLGGITIVGILLLAIASLIPAIDQIIISIGEGFLERTIAFPMGIWFVALGAHIIGSTDSIF